MDLLVANTLMLHKGKNLDTICQAEVLNTFHKTRQDIDKIFYSMYVSEVVHNFGLKKTRVLKLFITFYIKTLNAISASENKVEIMIAVIKFQLKMMIESGFSIEFDTCLHCHNTVVDETMYLVPNLGGIVCKNCAERIHYNKKQMPHKLRDFLNKWQLMILMKRVNTN